jgi:hypothetical protein
MERMAISEFKATCLAVLERVPHQEAGFDHPLRTAGGGSAPAFGAAPARELDWVHGGHRENPRRYRLSGQ